MTMFRVCSVDEVIQACPYADTFYTVDPQMDAKLRSLNLGVPDSPYVYLQELNVYGFIDIDGQFNTIDKALLDQVWPGYSHNGGYSPFDLSTL
jgi:hypothetical protein